MQPKPLSKERRAEIERTSWSTALAALPAHQYVGMILDLLADAQYWREAVKNHESIDTFENDSTCHWCYAVVDAMKPMAHKPDCPWLLAREE